MKNSKFLTVLWLIFILTLLVVGRTFSQMDLSSDSGTTQSPPAQPVEEVAVK